MPLPPPRRAASSTEGVYDKGAFAAHGIAVERLGEGLAAGPPALCGRLLRDMDRFLTLATLSPGPIAIHGPAGVGAGLGAGGELLASSLLIRRHGFDAAAALAWLRIAHPPAQPRMPAFTVVPAPPALDPVSPPSLPRSSTSPPSQSFRAGCRPGTGMLAGPFSVSSPALLSCALGAAAGLAAAVTAKY